MAGRAVGLDIGTFAVRAAEVALGPNPTLLNFGQVALPPGAVRNGEIVDTEAVGAAIRRLWSEGKFKARSVVVGVANQRVIVRQAELPAMSDQDMRSALQFEAQELIPIPLDEAVLDFQILEEFAAPDGELRARLLIAAAQRDMVRTHLAAVERAGLSPKIVDLAPFALIRALGAELDLGDGAGAEAIICIGGGVTNVVVHEQGVPRFVRVLLVGGEDITDAIASDLSVDLDAAEDLKRRAGSDTAEAGDAAVLQAQRIVAARLTPLIEEIRGSLDYYLAQTDSAPIRRVLVTGGTSRTAGVLERLQQALGGRVEAAHPLVSLRVGKIGLSETQLVDIEPVLAVPVGLALAAEPLPNKARRITLLPSEVTVVREQQRQTMIAAAGVGALAVLLFGLWLARGAQVNEAQSQAEDAEAEVARLQTEAAALGDATGLDRDITQRQTAIRNLLADDVAWTRLLQEVATVIPNDVWLTSFTGSSGSPGSANFSAMGFDQTSTARWLLRLGDLESLSQLWVPSSSKGEGPTGLVTFSSTASITDKAKSDRAAQYTGEAGE